jgi:L-galactose dehydrogenase
MIYRALGKTNLQVSIIGFGASSLGDVFGEVSQKDGREAVDHAIESGVTLFDVSPYYGLTKAEERLGDALVGQRDAVVLATKCGRYGSDDFDFSAKTIVREFEQSLRRLKTDHVDLLQAHDIEFGDLDQIIHETVPAMRRLQDQGKVRFIGMTSYWPGLLARTAEQTGVDTVLNYCHSNLLMDDMKEELVPFADRTGIGILNASPLHMGLLGGGIVPDWHPAPEEVKAAATAVVNLCRSFGEDPARLALWACLQVPQVASTLIGMASRAQVKASCEALTYVPPPELLAAIHAKIKPVFNTVWPSGREINSGFERVKTSLGVQC